MPPRAVIFDFNGTLSDDEPILHAIYADLFAARGRPLSERDYYDTLAGNTDEEIVRRWLGEGHPDVAGFVAERIARYCSAASDGSTVGEDVRAAVRWAAAQGPVAIVSGAARAEIEPVVAAAGLAPLLAGIVSADDVVEGKPHPEGYLRALPLLADGLAPADVLVFEDTEAGVAAATAAGMRCVGVTRTLGAARLARAHELIPVLSEDEVRRLLA